MNFDKSYIIGIPQLSQKRLDRCFKKFKDQNINVELWEGVYGADINLDKYKKMEYLSNDFKLNLPGSLGCLLSHVTLWEHCQKDPNCDIALILEDDVVLKSDFIN